MITRSFQKGDAASVAVYSDCERYRYSLTRVSGTTLGAALLHHAQPVDRDGGSERPDRGTLRTPGARAGLRRVPGPQHLCMARHRSARHARRRRSGGAGNDAAIVDSLPWADSVICAWGTHGAHLGRGPEVEALLRASGAALTHLGLSKDGHPKHPLYIGYAVQPVPWSGAD
jgi:hypothetical protein